MHQFWLPSIWNFLRQITWYSLLPHNLIFKLPSDFFCLDLKITNSVFLALSEVLPGFSQFTRYFKLAFTSFFSFLIELLRHNKLVSSAKGWTLQNCIAGLRSFTCDKNRRGPRTEPWGTSQFTVARANLLLFVETNWLRLNRYSLNQLLKTPNIPLWSNFANSIWWSTVSKAFYKLTKTPQPIFSSSRAFLISSVVN